MSDLLRFGLLSETTINTDQNNSHSNDFLRGKVVVVTGSTCGIGHAIAVEMARCGANVLVHGRDQARAVDVTRQLRRTSPGSSSQYSYVVADLSDHESHEKLVEAAWQWSAEVTTACESTDEVVSTTHSIDATERDFGGVDVWVNNAGIDVLTGEAAGWSFEEKLMQLWQVDVLATIRLSRLVAKRMKDRAGARGGVIINMGWDQVETGMAGDSGEMFSAIKGAVMSFSRSLAKSAAPSIRVNCVAPGWIKTKWGDATGDYWNARAVGESLVGRWGNPQDVARAVRFLASPDAAFINGQILNVDGGAQPWPVGWEANQDG